MFLISSSFIFFSFSELFCLFKFQSVISSISFSISLIAILDKLQYFSISLLSTISFFSSMLSTIIWDNSSFLFPILFTLRIFFLLFDISCASISIYKSLEIVKIISISGFPLGIGGIPSIINWYKFLRTLKLSSSTIFKFKNVWLSSSVVKYKVFLFSNI